MADRHKDVKSKYTLERDMPGAFEGETITRRRFMNVSAQGAGIMTAAAFTLPALGFAIGPLFSRVPFDWQPIGDRTNNEAEYYALLKALELIAEKATGKSLGNIGEALVRSDSKLVVNQVNGEWRVEDERLMELSSQARELIEKLGSIRLEWVPREENYAGLWLEGKLKPFSVERLR